MADAVPDVPAGEKAYRGAYQVDVKNISQPPRRTIVKYEPMYAQAASRNIKTMVRAVRIIESSPNVAGDP